MTEDEAKTKWCPFGERDAHSRSNFEAYAGMSCIGSQCMAWRRIIHMNFEMESVPDKPGVLRRKKAPTVTGYCGLAGKD
jgi:hypothetical protein